MQPTMDIAHVQQYPFGHGLSYTNFSTSEFHVSAISGMPEHHTSEFNGKSIITFSVKIRNTGKLAGSYVAQVYLLGRISSIVRPVKQLVAFQRVNLSPGEITTVEMALDVSRYMMILDREHNWIVEPGEYTFALLENGGSETDTSRNITLKCVT